MMCCLVRDIAHLVGRWNDDEMTTGKPNNNNDEMMTGKKNKNNDEIMTGKPTNS
jgi:hypothetical protein